MEIKENNNLYTGSSEIEKPKIKIRWKSGLATFFIVSGTGILLYKSAIFSSITNTISLLLLAFGATIAIVLSLYFTENMLVANNLKIWKVATGSLISAILFLFFYLISSVIFFSTIKQSEGGEVAVTIFFGVLLIPLVTFVIFVFNIYFCKFSYPREA